MKYFSLEHEYRKESIGPYPQSEGMADYYHYKKEDSIWNLWYDNPMMQPNLDAIKLVKGAILTDLLSVGVISPMAGKIVSERFKNLLQKYNLPKHHFFPAKVVDYRQQPVEDCTYYLFRIIEYQNQFINFDRSEFYIHSLGEGAGGSIDICCEEDLELSSEELGLRIGEVIKPNFISFSSEGNKDVFSFRRFSPGFLVSECLKSAVEFENLTGIRFEAVDYLLQDNRTATIT